MAQNWTLIWNYNWNFSKLYLLIYIYLYYFKENSPLYIELFYDSEIFLNLTFNGEKTWGQFGKNISPIPLKMSIK